MLNSINLVEMVIQRAKKLSPASERMPCGNTLCPSLRRAKSWISPHFFHSNWVLLNKIYEL